MLLADGGGEAGSNAGGGVPRIVAAAQNRELLWELLRGADQGGRGAHVFIAGRDRFVAGATEALSELAAACTGDGTPASGWEFVRDLAAERRISFQISPTPAPWRTPGLQSEALYDASKLVEHNNHSRGYWLALDGNVYDMTVFRHLHPGGATIIDGSAGMDATGEYSAVLHYRDAEINAMLAMFKIGEIRRLRFGGPDGAELHDLFRAWVRYLFLIVEMQNALENDLLYLKLQTTAVEQPDQLTALKLMMFENTHGRFVELYYKGLCGRPLAELWRRTLSVCGCSEDPARLDDELEAAAAAGAPQFDRLRHELRDLWTSARGGRNDPQFWAWAGEVVVEVTTCDRRFLEAMKSAIRAGVELFERNERAAAEHGSEVLEPLLRVPAVLDEYHRLLAGCRTDG
jgi:sulfite reductase (NADPH) flavoprotein alpha-component